MTRPLNTACAEPGLADAFAAFTAAAGRLEFSYQQLQQEVAGLRQELEDRNAALTRSLAENEKMRLMLGRILEAMPCGVVVLELGDQVSFVNPETQRLLGSSVEKGRLSEIARAVLARIPKGEEAEHEFCVNVAGKKRWLVVRSAQLSGQRTKAGNSEAETGEGQTVLTIRDVTAQREMEREREEARRLIALAEMTSVLAHEIRNPLGSMELLAGLLTKSTNLNGEQKSWVEHLQSGVRSMSATVNNVLRVHTGSSTLVPLPLAPVLREGVGFVKPLAEQAGVTLTLREDIGDAQISGNSGELQQVIINLALNAFRYAAAGGHATLTAKREKTISGQRAVVEFADTGSGIAPENLENIFEAGFSTSNHSPGLGLAVCRKIILQHGGKITVQSKVNQGTTFHMEFPLL